MKILITGTSSGIGRTLALQLGAAGHEIWGLARRGQTDLEVEAAAKGISLRTSSCDVSVWKNVWRCHEAVAADWGRLDALICCAAVQGPVGPTAALDPDQWVHSLAINLHGTFFCLRAFYDLLQRAERRAKVICFSGGGAASPRPNFTPYAVSKAGVVRLVENVAAEWIGQRIDINAIAPGAVDTQMTDQVIALGPSVAGEKEYQAALEQKKRGTTSPEKYAGLTTFLLSPESDGLSGRLLSAVWDPWSQLSQRIPELKGTDIYTLRRITPEERNRKWI